MGKSFLEVLLSSAIPFLLQRCIPFCLCCGQFDGCYSVRLYVLQKQAVLASLSVMPFSWFAYLVLAHLPASLRALRTSHATDFHSALS